MQHLPLRIGNNRSQQVFEVGRKLFDKGGLKEIEIIFPVAMQAVAAFFKLQYQIVLERHDARCRAALPCRPGSVISWLPSP